jgi:hypothetical protein
VRGSVALAPEGSILLGGVNSVMTQELRGFDLSQVGGKDGEERWRFAIDHPFTNADAAARKLVKIANAF